MKLDSDLRVLVVDDQESMRGLLRASLKSIEVTHVLEASGGRAALTLLASRRVDLVLLDCEMPEMDGVETLCAIRDAEDFGQVPVIMVTASASSARVRASAELGISGYLLKPVSANQLAERIRAI